MECVFLCKLSTFPNLHFLCYNSLYMRQVRLYSTEGCGPRHLDAQWVQGNTGLMWESDGELIKLTGRRLVGG